MIRGCTVMVVIKPVSVFRAIQCHATQGVVSVTALPASKASTVVKVTS